MVASPQVPPAARQDTAWNVVLVPPRPPLHSLSRRVHLAHGGPQRKHRWHPGCWGRKQVDRPRECLPDQLRGKSEPGHGLDVGHTPASIRRFPQVRAEAVTDCCRCCRARRGGCLNNSSALDGGKNLGIRSLMAGQAGMCLTSRRHSSLCDADFGHGFCDGSAISSVS